MALAHPPLLEHLENRELDIHTLQPPQATKVFSVISFGSTSSLLCTVDQVIL